MHGVRACVFPMQTKTISESLLIAILTLGVFGIINTEMGVVGIIPQIAERFDVTVSTAGLCVSVFALVVSVAAPVLPLLFSGINRRTMMLAALFLFVSSNMIRLPCFLPRAPCPHFFIRFMLPWPFRLPPQPPKTNLPAALLVFLLAFPPAWCSVSR